MEDRRYSPIGTAPEWLLQKFEQKRLEIYINDLAVAKQHRRKRIATRLINDLRQIARERFAYVIYIQTDRTDAAAIKLYESFGTREEVFHFDIKP